MVKDPKLKYIVVTPFFPSTTRWQGAFVLDQVKAIQRHSDYEVIVFKTHTWGDYEADYIIDGIKVYCINPLLMPSYILNGFTNSLVGKRFVNCLHRLNINIAEIKYVHCHTSNHAAFGLGVKEINPNAKVIVQFHDPDPLTLRNGKWHDKQWNLRYKARKSVETLNKADLLLCISEHVKNTIVRFPKPRENEVFEPALKMLEPLGDIPSVVIRDIYVLNNGVDCSLFRKINISDIDNKNIFRIGCIANFNDWKNHIMLVSAFKILIEQGYLDLRLSLLGSGETKDMIERYISKNNISMFVEWPDEVHHDKLPEYYNTLDLFVLPSRFEGFGCVYTEAYACGVPFICCENQGASECVGEEERELWLVRDQDVAHLAELIERQYLERNTQHLCKEYDIDKLIPPFLEYIQNI